MLTACNLFIHFTPVAPEGLFCKPKYRAIFVSYVFYFIYPNVLFSSSAPFFNLRKDQSYRFYCFTSSVRNI